MSNVENHPSCDENYVWEARSSAVSIEDAAVLQTLFENRLNIEQKGGKVVISTNSPQDTHELTKFMDAAILFQKRRVTRK